MYERAMKKKRIRLGNFTDVHEFVVVADSCDFDINIGYDRIMIDAKSIVGVMGLDLGRDLTVEYDGNDSRLENYLIVHGI